MKKLLASLLAFAGLAGAAPQESKVQTLDPKSILFSTPTISNDTASLEPGKDKPGASDFIFHEDEWSQRIPGKNRLAEVQRMLKEFKKLRASKSRSARLAQRLCSKDSAVATNRRAWAGTKA
ncbi:MAG: hypothetical protein IPH08_11085 [Rhodocyclaceae bacterium]|nr:hypothetical protein [Rhodocyclaceae bacterium]